MSPDLPSGWKRVPLLDLAALPHGQVDPRIEPFRSQVLIAPDHIESGTGRVLRYETAEAQGAISGKYRIAPGDVLLAKIRPALRKVAYSDIRGLCSADMYPLRAGSELDPRFLFAVLLSPGFATFAESRSGRSGIPKINRTELAEYRMALPPLPEQRRIADVLESVDESARSGERLLSKMDRLEMAFTEALTSHPIHTVAYSGPIARHGQMAPAQLRTRWPIRLLGDLLTQIEAGRSPDVPDQPASYDEWGVLKVSAIRPQGLVEAENKVVTQSHLIDPLTEVRSGDLLMSRANTTDLVGLACYVSSVRPKLMLSDKTLRLIVDPGKAEAEFVARVLATYSVRRQIASSGTGSSGSMKNISQDDIRSFLIPCPPLDEQRLLLMRLREIDGRAQAERRKHVKLLSLRQGLMNDLLTGRTRVKDAEELVEAVA